MGGWARAEDGDDGRGSSSSGIAASAASGIATSAASGIVASAASGIAASAASGIAASTAGSVCAGGRFCARPGLRFFRTYVQVLSANRLISGRRSG